MNWLTITTTLIAAIAPSIVSIITIKHQAKTNSENNKLQYELNKQNNECQTKLKYLDYYFSEQKTAVNLYLDSLLKYLNDQSDKNLINYQFSMAKASMFVSKKVYNDIYDIHHLIKDKHFDVVNNSALENLIDNLNAEAQQYK